MPLPPGPPPAEGTQPGPSALPELRRMLPELMLADQHRLRRHADREGGLRDPNARDKAIAKLASDIERARLRIDARRKAVPVICYPEELPVSQRKDDIAQAIRDHQVVIIAGETVRSWPSDDYWLDIGRHDDYEQAQEEFESVRDRLIPPE